MNLFLDTCVIIGYHIDADPQHEAVNNFINTHNVDLESNVTTCQKVADEIRDGEYKVIRRTLKRSKKLPNEDIRCMVKLIEKYLTKIIKIVNYSNEIKSLCPTLMDDIKFDLEEEPAYHANMSDIEIFSNFVIWSIKHNPVPKKPVFLTTDNGDYDKTDNKGNSVILNSVKNHFNNASMSLKNPLELIILNGSNIKKYN